MAPHPTSSLQKTLFTALIGVTILLLAAAGSGCKVIDESRVQDADSDTIPWNTRAGWEDTTIGVPY